MESHQPDSAGYEQRKREWILSTPSCSVYSYFFLLNRRLVIDHVTIDNYVSGNLEELTLDRAKFVEYQGKQIFVMACRDTTLDEMNAIIKECILRGRKQPEKSVFTLKIAGGNAFSGETISKLKDVARDDTPYVEAGAIVGVTGLYKVVFNAVAMFRKWCFYLFDTVDEAMDFWADYTD